MSSQLHALTCRYPGIDKLMRDAQVIFQGKAVAHGDDNTSFEVAKLYKGIASKEIKMSGKYNISDSYLIYAWVKKNGQLYTPECIFNHNINLIKKRSDSINYYTSTLERFYEIEAKLKLYRDVYTVGLWERLDENPDKFVGGTVGWYMELGDYQRALAVYEKYPRYIPDLDPPGVGRVNRKQEREVGRYVYLLAKNGRYTEAYDITNKFYQSNPENIFVQQHYSWLLFELSREDELPKENFSFAGTDFHYSFINFSKQEFRFLEFTGSDVSGLNLTEAKLNKLKIINSSLGLGKIIGAVIDGADYELVADSKSDYSASKIDKFSISDSKFIQTNFQNSSVKINASSSVFIDTNMENSILDESIFRNVRFSNPNLKQTSFRSSDLSGIYTFDENGIDFSEVIHDKNTVWPKEMDMKNMVLKPSILKYIQNKDSEDYREEERKRIYPGQYWLP